MVEKSIRYLWLKCETEGLFRVAGLQEDLNFLMGEFDKGKNVELEQFSFSSPILIAQLLKTYFRKLPEPILTYELYDKFIDSQSISDKEERLRVLRSLCDSLPDINHALLESFLLFLARIAKRKEKNKMSEANLAIIFAPSFLVKKDETPAIMLSHQKLREKVMVDIIENPKEMFGILMLKDIKEKYVVDSMHGFFFFFLCLISFFVCFLCGNLLSLDLLSDTSVKSCKDKVTNEKFTIKIVKKGKVTEKDIKNLQSEIAVLKTIRHPNVISLRAVCETEADLYLVTEYAAGGELFDEIIKRFSFLFLFLSYIIVCLFVVFLSSFCF